MEVPGTKWISINVDSFNSHFPKNPTKKSECLALGVKPRWGLGSVCLCAHVHGRLGRLHLTGRGWPEWPRGFWERMLVSILAASAGFVTS